jgi:hypothetical protein
MPFCIVSEHDAALRCVVVYVRACRYLSNMARFEGSAHPFFRLEKGEYVDFTSQGDFMSGPDLASEKQAGVTFWVATGCDAEGKCAWNGDRTQGAVLEWNMARGTLYYDLSAVEAMDEFRYTMESVRISAAAAAAAAAADADWADVRFGRCL